MHKAGVSAPALFASEPSSQPVSGNSIDTPYALIIDDDAAIVNVVIFLLETEGYASVGIMDSLKVLDFLDRLDALHLPGVILLDLMIPRLSGYDIAKLLSRDDRFRAIPIIIMTADSRIHDASAIEGAVDFISKPFHIDLLLAKLKFYLDPA